MEALNGVKHESSEVECGLVDLLNFSSIQQFAQKIVSRGVAIDALFNNAGVIMREFIESPDGLESR